MSALHSDTLRYFTDPAEAVPQLLGALEELYEAVSAEHVDPERRARALRDAQTVITMARDSHEAQAVDSPEPAFAHSVVLVQVEQGGDDLVLFVDGRFVVGAEPSAGDSVATVEATGERVAEALGVELRRCPWPAPREQAWSYEDIGAALFGEPL